MYIYKFVIGPGGCGKTFLYNTLIAQMKNEKKDYIACAPTGIASLLLIGGQTAHRAFRFDEIVDRETFSRFDFEKESAKKLREAKILIIDEISMLHSDVLHAIDQTLRDLQSKDEKEMPFGGKIVVLGGDWKQLLPVVKGI